MKEIGDLSPFSASACTLNTYKEGGKKKKKAGCAISRKDSCKVSDTQDVLLL